ncbi:hypothetical protein LSAT2_030886 [Lamellibrachia satsuma]|nr:hypothetical protein LSAT2_030886 [Lamellibrachia satsuma]
MNIMLLLCLLVLVTMITVTNAAVIRKESNNLPAESVNEASDVSAGSPIRVKRFQTMRPPVQYYIPKLDPWIVWKPKVEIQGNIPVF